MTDCKKCGGEGRLYKSKYGGNDPDVWDAGQCDACEGKGSVPESDDDKLEKLDAEKQELYAEFRRRLSGILDQERAILGLLPGHHEIEIYY